MSTYDDEYIRRLEREVKSVKKQLEAARDSIGIYDNYRTALFAFVQDPPKMTLETAIKQAKRALRGLEI